MTITSKTRKILWGRSGNRCAICRRELIEKATVPDEEAVIGEECHIVAQELNGPRGNEPLPLDQRDESRNLILLCRNHHKVIDDQPLKFTVDILQDIKVKHEDWVQEILKPRKNNTPSIFYAFRIDTGTQLCASAIGCHAWHFHNDLLDNKQEAELIGTFSQDFQDYNNLWSTLESRDRVVAQFEFEEQVKLLYEQGFLVYGVEREQQFRSDAIKEPFSMTVGYIFVVRKKNKLVERKDAETEQLMQLPIQLESEYTNFIPVVHDTTSVRFV